MSSSSSNIPHSHGMPSSADNNDYHGSNYVFTINNPNNNTETVLFSKIGHKISDLITGDNNNHVTYAVWSLERGSSGTPHIQGYFQTQKKVRYNAMKNKLKKLHLWCAPARGSPQSNIDYISHTGEHAHKAGDLIEGPWYLGSGPSKSGTRSDISGLADALKSGKSMVSIANEQTEMMIKYFGNASKLHSLLNTKQRKDMTELYIYTGVAGSGKSHAAYNEAIKYLQDNNIDQTPYMLMVPSAKNQPLWWQDYDGHAVVIIDDFYGEIDINYFKRLVDKYPMKVNLKNGHTEFLAKRIYITSNQGWRTWWQSDLLANKENEAAIERRITVNKHFDTKYTSKNVVEENDVEVLDAPIRANANQGLIFNNTSQNNDDWIFNITPENVQDRLVRRPMSPLPHVTLSQQDRDFLDSEFGEAANARAEQLLNSWQ